MTLRGSLDGDSPGGLPGEPAGAGYWGVLLPVSLPPCLPPSLLSMQQPCSKLLWARGCGRNGEKKPTHTAVEGGSWGSRLHPFGCEWGWGHPNDLAAHSSLSQGLQQLGPEKPCFPAWLAAPSPSSTQGGGLGCHQGPDQCLPAQGSARGCTAAGGGRKGQGPAAGVGGMAGGRRPHTLPSGLPVRMLGSEPARRPHSVPLQQAL